MNVGPLPISGYEQLMDQMRETGGNGDAKSIAARLGRQHLRHREVRRQVHTDILMAAMPMSKYRKGEFFRRLFQAM